MAGLAAGGGRPRGRVDGWEPVPFMTDYETGTQSEGRVSPFLSWLSETMRTRGVTPKHLAARSGLSKSMISMLLAGQRDATPENVAKIARGLAPEGDDAQADMIEKAGRLAAGFAPDEDDSDLDLTLEREYETPSGETFKLYGLGDLPPDILDAIREDVDRRMREWNLEERLRRVQDRGASQ